MSGNVLQRRPATVAFVVALTGALVLLALGARAVVRSASPADSSTAGIVAIKPVVHYAAQRAATSPGHPRAAALSASQRIESGAVGLRTLVGALLAGLCLAATRRRGPGRDPVRMHGVRAPPPLTARAFRPSVNA